MFPPVRPDFVYTEAEVVKYLEYFCYDQSGCRMIQRMMDETKDQTFIRAVIKKLMPIFLEV